MKRTGLTKMKVRARISRAMGGSDYFELTIEDISSGLRIIEAKLNSEQFADLLSNRQASDLEAEVNVSGNIGKKREVMTVSMHIDQDNTYLGTEEALTIAFDKAQAEYPEWTISREKWNSHRYSPKNKTYLAHMHRYVEIPESDNK